MSYEWFTTSSSSIRTLGADSSSVADDYRVWRTQPARRFTHMSGSWSHTYEQSPTIIWLNKPFPLPDFTMFTAATESARDKTRHVYTSKWHLFKCKSNLKCFWLIYNNAMAAQTCTRLLEACKSAAHDQCKLCAYISWCLCWTVGHFPVSSKLSDSHSHTHTHTETRQEMASLYIHKKHNCHTKIIL